MAGIGTLGVRPAPDPQAAIASHEPDVVEQQFGSEKRNQELSFHFLPNHKATAAVLQVITALGEGPQSYLQSMTVHSCCNK